MLSVYACARRNGSGPKKALPETGEGFRRKGQPRQQRIRSITHFRVQRSCVFRLSRLSRISFSAQALELLSVLLEQQDILAPPLSGLLHTMQQAPACRFCPPGIPPRKGKRHMSKSVNRRAADFNPRSRLNVPRACAAFYRQDVHPKRQKCSYPKPAKRLKGTFCKRDARYVSALRWRHRSLFGKRGIFHQGFRHSDVEIHLHGFAVRLFGRRVARARIQKRNWKD